MFDRVWGRIPEGLRKRPFDIYTALLLMLIGLYSMLDPNFPEKQEDTISNAIVFVISLYMIISGSLIIWSTMSPKRSNPIFHFYGEMYGWMFMASATVSIAVFQLWNAHFSRAHSITDPILFWGVLALWLSVTAMSAIRATDMWMHMRSLRK
jgi:hypothetical protein